MSRWHVSAGKGDRRLLSMLSRSARMKLLLQACWMRTNSCRTYGIRALSQCSRRAALHVPREWRRSIASTTSPASPASGLFGGNSNWRGPIWFPVNFLLIESLQKFHHYYGDDFKSRMSNRFGQVHDSIGSGRGTSRRLTRLFLATSTDARPFMALRADYHDDPHFAIYFFYEYFHGDTGRGLGRLTPDRLDRPDR